MNKLGFVTSLENIATYKNICTVFEDKENGLYDDKEIYKRIAEKCKTNSLTNTEKQRLFQNFTNEQTKFTDIGYETLINLSLFCNTNNDVKPLKDLVNSAINTPDWLNTYKIKADENFPELKSYLIAESKLYEKIILVNWASIILKVSNILEFYQKVKNYYSLKENMASLADKATIYTNEGGFRKSAEVFYNPLFDTVNDYDSLQNLILKAANLPTPQQNIRQFFSDEKSPFKITKNQKIKDVINTCENLDYQEVISLLEFSKLNQERIFDAIYIQKQGEKYSIIKHNQSVFQYHSDRNDVIALLATNNTFKLLPNEFKSNDFINLGLLQKDELHTQILNQGFDRNLLPIILDSTTKLKNAFIDKITQLEITKGEIYDENSFENKFLKLAIDCGKVQEVAAKIRIFGKYKISELNEQDDVNFTIDEKNYKLKLSVILKRDEGTSNIANEVIEQFKGFKAELKKHFFTQENNDNTKIYQELLQIKQISNIEQFAFVLFQSKYTETDLFPNFEIQIENTTILNYCFSNKIDFLRTYTSNFKDFSLGGKIYPLEFALDNEKLPSWVYTWLETDTQNKLNYLDRLGVYVSNSNIVLLRKFFKTNEGHENIEVYFANISNPQFLSNTLLWLQTQNITFNSSETVKLDYLRKIYDKISFTAETPLLYVQKIVADDITYNLETTTATKYYYTDNQIRYLQRLFEILQQKNCKLLAFAGFFEKWKSITNAIEIEISYYLDIEKLNQNSKEWQTEHYKKWKEINNYKIFVFDGDKIPRKIMFLNELVENYTSGTDSKNINDIYFCKSVENQIESLLVKYVEQKPLLDLFLLKVGNSVEVQSLQNKVVELEATIKRLQTSSHSSFQGEFTGTPTDEDYNKETGYLGEAFVYEELTKKKYRNVIWVNQSLVKEDLSVKIGNNSYQIKESFKMYDLTFENEKEQTCYVQIKASKRALSQEDSNNRIGLIITKDEWQFLEKQDIKDFYYIARVFDARGANPEMKLLKVEFQQQ